jgi:DNA-binding NtrC family response regulator
MTEKSHILVVEDDDAFRRMVIRLLAKAGYRATHANGFASALKVVEADQTIGLLLIDVGMPAGTPHGIAIANMSRLRHSQLKVIYMTGGDAQQIARHTDNAPVLQKPFSADLLIQTIEKMLSKPSTAAP